MLWLEADCPLFYNFTEPTFWHKKAADKDGISRSFQDDARSPRHSGLEPEPPGERL
jgi:hypothetical protein